jgi:hypothetical protein
MLIVDEIFTCQDSLKRTVQCRLLLYSNGGAFIGIACELPPPYDGPSVTNAAEHIWKAVRDAYALTPVHPGTPVVPFFCFECYPMHKRNKDIEIDKVLLGFANQDVVWKPSSRAEVERLIGEMLPL